MTHSPTPAELLAIKTGNAALLNSPDSSVDIVSTIVFALGSAGLLMDPEKAKRFAELEAAAGDGHTRTVEDRIAYALTEKAEALRPCCAGPRCTCTPFTPVDDVTAEALHASSGAVIEVPQDARRAKSVVKLRGLLAGQREDAHDSPLHHTYAVGRDLPEGRP